jgi:hypothetical protein
MSATLDKMKRLMALGLPAKKIVAVMEIIEGESSGPTRQRRKRRKRRTRAQMARDAAKGKKGA